LIMASARGIPPNDPSAGLPLVLLNNQADQLADSIHSVTVDDRTGAQLAASHLIELGHRQIGCIGVASRAASNQRRHLGYLDALAAAGLPADDRFVITAASMAADPDADLVAGRTLLPQLLADAVSAVVCYNDMVAIGALMACRQLGLRVPEDISIVGFDDIAFARYTVPELTTVRQPREEMGRVAMQILLSLLAGKRTRGFVAQPVLLVRSSTGPVAQAQSGASSKKPPVATKSNTKKT
jgi:LacI family transcriptional regulator/LacI family repressor for deo operon, udp, cdd, tsx, nupC, and nupG